MSASLNYMTKAAGTARAVELATQGQSQRQIAQTLGVAQATVCRWLGAIRTEWRDGAVSDLGAMVARELQVLDFAETEAVGSWEASKRSALGPDHQFLALVVKISAQRSRLLNLPKALTAITPPATEDAPVASQSVIETRLAHYATSMGHGGVVEMELVPVTQSE